MPKFQTVLSVIADTRGRESAPREGRLVTLYIYLKLLEIFPEAPWLLALLLLKLKAMRHEQFPLLQVLLSLLLLLGHGCGKNPESSETMGLSSKAVRWNSWPVPIQVDSYLLDAEGANAYADIEAAVSFWEAKAGRPVFEIKGPWDMAEKPYTGPNPSEPQEILANVLFLQGPWPFDSAIAGKTVVRSEQGTISAGLILLNAEAHLCGGNCGAGGISRRRLITHELGHMIGLGHVEDENNIMYPAILPGASLNAMVVDQEALGFASPNP